MNRRDAAIHTVVAYLDKDFRWGEADCVRLAASVLRNLGYKPGLNRGGRYTTEFGAARALRRAGFTTTEGWVDDVVGPDNRIDLTLVKQGDIIGFNDGSASLTALSVSLGNGRVLGFHSDAKCRILEPRFDVAGVAYYAWRCDPRG